MKTGLTHNPLVGSQAWVPGLRISRPEPKSVLVLKLPRFMHSCHKYLLNPDCVSGKLQALGIKQGMKHKDAGPCGIHVLTGGI